MNLKKIFIPFKQDKKFNAKTDKELDECEGITQGRLDSIKFGEKSLLVFYSDYYQMIDCGDKFLFVKIKSFEVSPLITDFDNIPDTVINNRKNIVINKKDISSVTVVMGEDSEFWDEFSDDINYGAYENDTDYCFGFSIECTFRDSCDKVGKTQNITYNFYSWEPIEEKPLHNFFDGVKNVEFTSYEEYKKSLTCEVSESDKKIAKHLKLVTKTLSIASLAAGILTAVVEQNSALLVLRSICIIAILLMLGLYFIFRKYFIFDNDYTYSLINVNDKSHISAIVPTVFILCGSLLAWESMNIEIIQLGKSWLIAFAAAAVVILLLLCITAKRIKALKRLVLLALLVLMTSFYTVNLINITYDFHEPTICKYMITETDENNHSLTVINANAKELIFDVTQEEFSRADKGDNVIITEHRGALGIEWAEIDISFIEF